MAVITDSSLVDILLALIPVLYILYWCVTNNNDYWDKKGVPNVKKGLSMGSFLGTQSQADAAMEIYNKFSDQRFAGLFQFKQPVLMVRDPILLNKILVKDFIYFQDRGLPTIKNDPFSKNLFALKGRIWRELRYKLTPTFTTGKLRGMFEQISKSADNVTEKIKEHIPTDHTAKAVDPQNFLFEFTLEVIASCAFGVQYQPGSTEFNKFKAIVELMFSVSPLRFFRIAIVMTMPKIAEFFNMPFTSSEVVEYVKNLTRATIKYRKENNIERNDYFQLLLSIKEQEERGGSISASASQSNEEDAIIDQMQYTDEGDQSDDSSDQLFTEDSISANTVIFLTGGSETVARTLGFVLFELSRHLDIQQKVQQEVDSVFSKHGSWSYEALRDLTYMDQVIQESQRMHDILPILQRECVRPYKVPDSDLIIEKGVLIIIPVEGLHKDPKYYPNPDEFNPDRFKGNNFKPNSTYLPFGDGPRICIAMRFAVMEMKACLAKILAQYSVKLSDKTKLPLQFDIRSFISVVKDGIFLCFENRLSEKVKS